MGRGDGVQQRRGGPVRVRHPVPWGDEDFDWPKRDDGIPEGCVRVDNRLYDARMLEEWHPGGRIFVQAFSGHDATEPFVMYHRRRFPHTHPRVREAFVKVDESFQSTEQAAFDDYLELSDRVAKELLSFFNQTRKV